MSLLGRQFDINERIHFVMAIVTLYSQRATAIGAEKCHDRRNTKRDLPRFNDQRSASFLRRVISCANDNATKFLRVVSWSLISNYSTPH